MREVHPWLGKVESSLSPILLYPTYLTCNTQVEPEPPPLLVLLLLVAVDLEKELGSLGGHEVGVAVDQAN